MTVESHILSIEHVVHTLPVSYVMFGTYIMAYCWVNNTDLLPQKERYIFSLFLK
jgi:hypothetical protein